MIPPDRWLRGENTLRISMKILHLIWDDLDNPWVGGGGAKSTHEINKRLAARHEITVLTGSFPNSSPVIRDGVLYQRIGWGKSHLLSLVTYSLSIPFSIRKHKFDLIIDDFCAYSPAFAPLYTRKPVIALIQNLFETKAIQKHKLLGIWAYLFEGLGLYLYRNFIAISPSIEGKIRRKKGPGARITCLTNAPDAFLFSLESHEEDFILFLGRLEIYQKGLDVLIKAFAAVAKTYPHIELKLAGPIHKKDKQGLQ